MSRHPVRPGRPGTAAARRRARGAVRRANAETADLLPLFEKTGATNRVQLAITASRAGLVDQLPGGGSPARLVAQATALSTPR